MPTTIKIIHDIDFIRVTATGEFDFDATRKALLEVALTVAPLSSYVVLVDTRKAHTQLSDPQLWTLAKEVEQHPAAFGRKTAILCRPERVESAEFFALCAENRGAPVRVFTSFEVAMDWLSE